MRVKDVGFEEGGLLGGVGVMSRKTYGRSGLATSVVGGDISPFSPWVDD